jgi:predicted ATP-grasp superfamily ATP-dependent carboligase
MLKTTTPVVLLRAIRHGSLCVARTLGSLGIPVFVVDPNRWSSAVVSRYCRGYFAWDFDASSAEESVQFLLAAARKIGSRPILIPTTDASALLVAEHADLLRTAYDFPDQRPGLALALSNKASMFHLARQCGIPTPETFFPRCQADVHTFLESAAFPVMLKAIDYGILRRTFSGDGKQIATSRDDVLLKYDQMQSPDQPNLVLQEYIPGGDDTIWMFNGYFDRDSACLFGMTGQKIRQSPVHTGSTCLGVCLQNDEVRALTLHFMKSIGYRGILDIGYRYDARDRLYKVLDVNPRIGSTFRLFVGDGDMDVARALYRDRPGQPAGPALPRYGRKWMVEDCDLVSSIRYYRDGQLTVKDWLRSFRGVQETAFFSLRDPLPGIITLASDGHQLAARIFHRNGRASAGHASHPGHSLLSHKLGK